MLSIITFWALILVSLKLLVIILIDTFRPLPKPTGKRESRESMFLCPTRAALTAMKNGRGPDSLPSWPTPPGHPPRVTVKIDLWGLDLEASKRLIGLRKWCMRRASVKVPATLGFKVVRAKLALAKNLGIPLQRVLDEDLWRHPDCLRWNGLNLNLVLGSRSNKASNLSTGWIKKSTYYDYQDGSPTPDYYIWMLPNYDFTEWKVVGMLSYPEVGRCIHRMRRSNASAEKRGSSYRRPDLFESEQFIGVRNRDLRGGRNWAHPLDWYRKVTSTKAGN